MAAALDTPRGRRERNGLALAASVLVAVAYLGTRLALTWRFPLYVDETTFASFARDVHGNLGQFFAAEIDKKGLLPSWLGAVLIGAGIDPVTAMRLLAAAGAALAAICGGLLVRRLYGVREGILTAALIALGPYFLVNASVGIYDAMVTGLVTAAILLAVRLAQRPGLATALLLGVTIGAGGLTKPTASVAIVVLPFTLLLFDRASPGVRRRLLRWAAFAVLAVAIGYALTSIARFSSLYGRPMVPRENHRDLGQIFNDVGPSLRGNGPLMWWALYGYLTLPGLALAITGVISGLRRHRAAATILLVWTASVIVSALFLALWPYPRYFAAAMVPLSAFVALGAVALWESIVRRSWLHRGSRILVASAVVALTFVPAGMYEANVIADPVHTPYPGADLEGYIWATSAQTWVGPAARVIERQGGPFPARIDVLSGYTWGIDLRLNGDAIGAERRYTVFAGSTRADAVGSRYLISDGARTDAPPRPGFRLIFRKARPLDGAVTRVFERARA